MTQEGLIFNIKKFAIHDGPGIRTTIFFYSCPLDCWWCHNPECKIDNLDNINKQLDQSNSESNQKTVQAYKISSTALLEEILKDEIFYTESNGGVTFSGGEPMMQVDFLLEMLKICKAAGIHTTVDTTGYAPFEKYEQIYDFVDILLYDLKLIDNVNHQRYTGVSNLLILENLRRLTELGNKVKLRQPLIPGISDTDENLQATADFIQGLRNIDQISLLPYNKFGEDKLRRYNLSEKIGPLEIQTDDKLKRCGRFFEEIGLNVFYGG